MSGVPGQRGPNRPTNPFAFPSTSTDQAAADPEGLRGGAPRVTKNLNSWLKHLKAQRSGVAGKSNVEKKANVSRVGSSTDRRDDREPERKKARVQPKEANQVEATQKATNSTKQNSNQPFRNQPVPPPRPRSPHLSLSSSKSSSHTFPPKKPAPAKNFCRSSAISASNPPSLVASTSRCRSPTPPNRSPSPAPPSRRRSSTSNPSKPSKARTKIRDAATPVRKTRSSGPAVHEEIPWGYKNGGALLGQPTHVQVRKRKQLEKQKAKVRGAAKRRRESKSARSKLDEADTEKQEEVARLEEELSLSTEGTDKEGENGSKRRKIAKERPETERKQVSVEKEKLLHQGNRKRKHEEDTATENRRPTKNKEEEDEESLQRDRKVSETPDFELNTGREEVAQIERVADDIESGESKTKPQIESTIKLVPSQFRNSLSILAPLQQPPNEKPTISPTIPSLSSLGLNLFSLSSLQNVPLAGRSLPPADFYPSSAKTHPSPTPFFFRPASSPEKVIGYQAVFSEPPQTLPATLPILPQASTHRRFLIKPSRVQPPPVVAKEPKPRKRDPALLSKEGWVVPERDVKIRANGRPPIWAVGRQELCESLSYFKSYQGGHYDRAERCHGYLLDGFPSANDRCEQNGKVIISHGGGNSRATSAGYVLHSSQERQGVRMRALQNCLDQQVPVILLAGNQYSFFPKLQEMGLKEGGNEVRYAVLGAYFVTHIWAEGEPVIDSSAPPDASKEEYFVRFKVRFEWVESQGTPWFHNVIGKEPDSFPAQSNPPPSQVTCSLCRTTHRAIYKGGITCYNETCRNFFRLPTGRMLPPSDLLYDSSMLNLSPNPPQNALLPQPIQPQTLQSLASSPSIRNYSRAAWRGFGCSECGRLSSRSEWLKLNCQECGAEVDATGSSVSIDELQKATRKEVRGRKPTAFGQPLIRLDSIPQRSLEGIEGYDGQTYELADGAKVHHLWPTLVEGYDEANRLFQGYQGKEAGKLFKRNPLTIHRAQGALLCQQFTWNGGKEYLHAIAAETYPFDESSSTPSLHDFENASDSSTRFAAPCAKEACDYLQSTVARVVSPDNVAQTAFNEILSVAYMEGGMMNYHDDGERGLGSVVASISLGADATMSFRRKEKKSKKKRNDSEPTPRGCKISLRLKLRHGDICIMEGPEMQKLFEHAVEPEGLRFAATARLVGPDHVRKSASRPQKFAGETTKPALENAEESLFSPAAPLVARPPLRSPTISLSLPAVVEQLDHPSLLSDNSLTSPPLKPSASDPLELSPLSSLTPSMVSTPELSSDLTSLDSSSDSSTPGSPISNGPGTPITVPDYVSQESCQSVTTVPSLKPENSNSATSSLRRMQEASERTAQLLSRTKCKKLPPQARGMSSKTFPPQSQAFFYSQSSQSSQNIPSFRTLERPTPYPRAHPYHWNPSYSANYTPYSQLLSQNSIPSSSSSFSQQGHKTLGTNSCLSSGRTLSTVNDGAGAR
ncbi:uncharacterized protein JCM6883_006331 [Sporobolomyces salmoneus]|uniref:uncharacterized protein n=1 Tax=Sporobolomyces salmoneus TaxID=183962 RepID=UPI003175ABD5